MNNNYITYFKCGGKHIRKADGGEKVQDPRSNDGAKPNWTDALTNGVGTVLGGYGAYKILPWIKNTAKALIPFGKGAAQAATQAGVATAASSSPHIIGTIGRALGSTATLLPMMLLHSQDAGAAPLPADYKMPTEGMNIPKMEVPEYIATSGKNTAAVRKQGGKLSFEQQATTAKHETKLMYKTIIR